MVWKGFQAFPGCLQFPIYLLEKEMATHCSVLAWRIPGMGEPGGLPSMGSHRVGHQGDLPNPGIKPRSPSLQAITLPAEPPGKPKNTGMGNLSLLQGIFLTQKSNRGLLHCRQILYRMSYQGSPRILEWVTYPYSRGSS